MEAVEPTPERSISIAVSERCRCPRAMVPSRRIFIAEILVPSANALDPIKVINVDTLGIMGGRERTSDKVAALFTRAGLTAGRILARGSRISLLEAFSNLERQP